MLYGSNQTVGDLCAVVEESRLPLLSDPALRLTVSKASRLLHNSHPTNRRSGLFERDEVHPQHETEADLTSMGVIDECIEDEKSTGEKCQ